MNKVRSAFWDNYKGILIILVVIGHFLFSYYQNLNNNLANTITTFIYLFHMPAFIFTTGYLSKSENVFKKKAFLKLILIFLLFNTGIMLFDKLVNGTSFSLLSPYYSYWYILSVIWWRLIIRPLSKIKHLLPISILISILIGFWPGIDNTLSIVRTISFFPFFVLGYQYDFKNLKEKILKDSKLKLFLTTLITIFFFGILFLIAHNYNFSINYLLYYTYKNFNAVFIRIFLIIISLITIFLLYFTIPNKKIPFITKWGKNCLLIYLIHRPITIIFQKIFSYQTYNDEYIIYALIATFILMLIFGSELINKYFNKFLSFLTNNIINKTIYKYGLIIFIICLLSLKPIEIITDGNNKDKISIQNITTLLK